MSVISVPGSLKKSTLIILLCIPLAALETVLISKAPWSRTSLKIIGTWSLVASIFCLPLCVAVWRARKWAVVLGAFFAAIWIAVSIWMAMRMGLASLGYFSVFQLFAFGAGLVALSEELRQSYLDPKLRWFQGSPKAIPGLTCQVGFGEAPVLFRVTRFDSRGAFLTYGERSSAAPFEKKTLAKLHFSFRHRELVCAGRARSSLYREGQALGLGFEFQDLSLDQKKEIDDFLELLRGEGYVQ